MIHTKVFIVKLEPFAGKYLATGLETKELWEYPWWDFFEANPRLVETKEKTVLYYGEYVWHSFPDMGDVDWSIQKIIDQELRKYKFDLAHKKDIENIVEPISTIQDVLKI